MERDSNKPDPDRVIAKLEAKKRQQCLTAARAFRRAAAQLRRKTQTGKPDEYESLFESTICPNLEELARLLGEYRLLEQSNLDRRSQLEKEIAVLLAKVSLELVTHYGFIHNLDEQLRLIQKGLGKAWIALANPI